MTQEAAEPHGRWLRGVIVRPDGSPAALGRVAVIELRGGKPDEGTRRVSKRASVGGEFELAVPEWAMGRAIHLSARERGHRPYSDFLVIDDAALRAHHRLELEEGKAIEGRVLRDGQPVEGAQIDVDVAWCVQGIYGAGPESWWAHGRMEEKHASTRTDRDGNFRLNGLSAASHRLALYEPEHEENRIRAHVFEVAAPDRRVYDLTSGTVRLDVRGPEGPLEGASIGLSTAGGSVNLTSGESPVEADVPPDRDLKITVTHPSALPFKTTVVSPGPGRWLDVPVSMTVVQRPRLTVTALGATALGANHIGLRLWSADGASTQLTAVAAATSDTFVVEAVPLDPGAYTVSYDPRDQAGRLGLIYSTVAQITLPASGDVEAAITCSLGGRCDLQLDSDADGDWSAAYTLVDASGTVHVDHQVSFGTFTEDLFIDEDGFEFEDSYIETTSNIEPGAARGGSTYGVLPPGRYELRVSSDDFADEQRSIQIRAGETATVEVTLRAEVAREEVTRK